MDLIWNRETVDDLGYQSLWMPIVRSKKVSTFGVAKVPLVPLRGTIPRTTRLSKGRVGRVFSITFG